MARNIEQIDSNHTIVKQMWDVSFGEYYEGTEATLDFVAYALGDGAANELYDMAVEAAGKVRDYLTERRCGIGQYALAMRFAAIWLALTAEATIDEAAFSLSLEEDE